MSSMSPMSELHGSTFSVAAEHHARALDIIMRTHLAEDPPQLLETLFRATAAIGATASIYTVGIPETEAEPSSFSLFACHPALAKKQHRLGPLSDHPWFRLARGRSAPATDRQIQLASASDEEALDLAREYGFKSCLIVPTSSVAVPERLEMLCLGSTDSEAFEIEEARTTRTLARALAAELHDWVNRYLGQRLQEMAGLHQPDIDLLRLEWQGLGTKEISIKTGMTPASVDSRFQKLNVRLACANRKASARRAAAYGLLDAA